MTHDFPHHRHQLRSTRFRLSGFLVPLLLRPLLTTIRDTNSHINHRGGVLDRYVLWLLDARIVAARHVVQDSTSAISQLYKALML